MKKSFLELLNIMRLINAVSKNDSIKVKKMLNKKVDPNGTIDDDELTPLHFAVVHRAFSVIPLLLAAGANINAVNIHGVTPLELAKVRNLENECKVLFDTSREHPSVLECQI